MQEMHSVSPPGDSIKMLRKRLEEFISLVAQNRAGYSIDLYPQTDHTPATLVCCVAWTDEAVFDLHSKIAELVPKSFPQVSRPSLKQFS